MKKIFDTIVIGGGHAGIEAAISSSKTGAKTILITNNINTIGELSCNPAIGGIGKSHLVKEIDAMGGVIGKAADNSGIFFQKLNKSKGNAVQSTRIQVDRNIYKNEINKILKKQKKLTIKQKLVTKILINKNKIFGITTKCNEKIFSTSLVIATGTFLNGKIFFGNIKDKGGRIGDHNSKNLNNNLIKIFKKIRLKTGTPPRIALNSINFKKLEKQNGEKIIPYFSCWTSKIKPKLKQKKCYITETNTKTHKIIFENLKKSSIYSGKIISKGPRYCPSIEDKIKKFTHKESHNIFLEHEGENSFEIYPNGISTSLPLKIQEKFIKTIKGLEECKIIRPGYAIEYSSFNPKNLHKTLETKKIKNLYFAGQINGTTGYEEAAAQGLIAGINAGNKAKKKENFYISRKISYIGVLIDDLITKGITEPYRMFTNRSENRLELREDNADHRLSKKAYENNLISKKKWLKLIKKKKYIIKNIKKIKQKNINIKYKIIEKKLKNKSNKKISIINSIKFPNNNFLSILKKNKKCSLNKNINIGNYIESQIKYSGYIEKQKKTKLFYLKYKKKKLNKINIKN